MLPKWLVDFLDKNPYPSLSFLPVDLPTGEKQIMFYLQDEKKFLQTLEGDIQVNFQFYREPHALIMRIILHISQEIHVETKDYSFSRYQKEFPYIETEFFDSDAHRFALNLLEKQDSIMMLLYDKKTGYIHTKRFNFQNAKELLKKGMVR